ncbi:hypothetical protein EG329_005156 [Mollisiaceae sp. DMI_Dod_QoI]|nr:hypothetical protein EG329_005156 [Helotiales sp. DMI_Dod_QoI]
MSSEVGCFQVLEIPQNVERKSRILGCVIPSASCTNPFDTYAPYWDDPRWEKDKANFKELEDAIDFFWQPSKKDGGKAEGVELMNVIASRGANQEDEGKSQATKMLKAHASRVLNKDVVIEAGKAFEYTIDNPNRAVATRLDVCKPWREELQRLYDDDPRDDSKRTFYLVTGVYTCKDMKVDWSTDKITKAGFKAELPGEALAAAATGGAPVPDGVAKALDSNAEYEHSRTTETETSARIKEEIIFALRYHNLDLKFEDQHQKSLISRVAHKTFGKSGQTAEAPKKIKSVALGLPVRRIGFISSYGGDDQGVQSIFYWLEPRYIEPDSRKEVD